MKQQLKTMIKTTNVKCEAKNNLFYSITHISLLSKESVYLHM